MWIEGVAIRSRGGGKVNETKKSQIVSKTV